MLNDVMLKPDNEICLKCKYAFTGEENKCCIL